MPNPNDGVIEVTSRYPVAETIDQLEERVRARGLMVFARIDFGGDAARAGLTLRPMESLLFGNPRAGTPVLAANPRAGLDLPLRALAWEAGDGVVRVSYNSPEWVAARHGIPEAVAKNLEAIHSLISEATGAPGEGAPAIH
ncbi:MAG TPA: DUF302 domain-containing protein [Anaeromyxobacteraceae bacterium]|nr:DUF302 domain-containing protein [Anaeromyxobacteraceae bacterium]